MREDSPGAAWPNSLASVGVLLLNGCRDDRRELERDAIKEEVPTVLAARQSKASSDSRSVWGEFMAGSPFESARAGDNDERFGMRLTCTHK